MPTSNPKPDLREIARRAGLELIAGAGTVGVMPERALAGLDTYFWLGGTGTRSAQRSADGFDLGIQAQPVGYVWDFGDGTVLTGGPGHELPVRTSDIQHMYQERGWYTVEVAVDWRVTFEVDGQVLEAPGEFRTAAATRLEVDELRAIITH